MFEKGKEYTTKGGHRARIYATDGGGKYPIHGAIQDDGGEWLLARWAADGVHTGHLRWSLTPPLVVTGDEIQAFRAAANIETAIIPTRSVIAGLEAAIRLHLSKRGGA